MSDSRSIKPDRVIQAFDGNSLMTADELRRRPLALTLGDCTITSDDVETIYRMSQAPGRRGEARELLGRALGGTGPADESDLVDFLALLDDTLVASPASGAERPPDSLAVARLDRDVLTKVTDGRASYGTAGASPMRAAFDVSGTGGGASLRGGTRTRVPDPGPNQLAIRDAFASGTMVYTQNFGVIDPAHIGHHARTFRDTYRTVMDAYSTTPPATRTVTLTLGSGVTEFPTTYTITPPVPGPGDTREIVAERIARQVVLDAGLRYEQHTSIWGMNNALPGHAGKSAFSTEDLPSNALGVEAGAAYVRGEDVRPGESLDDYAVRFVTSRGGTLYQLNDSSDSSTPGMQLRIRSFGNETYRPVYAPRGPKPEAGASLYRVFDQAEAFRAVRELIDVKKPDAGRGWYVSDPGPSLVGGVWNRVTR